MSVILLLCLLFTCAAPAERTGRPEPETGQSLPMGTSDRKANETSEFETDGTVLVRYHGTKSTVTVPSGMKTIGSKAFEGNTQLKKVILPDSVRVIEKKAFADCTALKKVELGTKSKLKEIKSKAFLNCGKLDTSFVPKGVKVAGDAFEGTSEPTRTPKPTGTEGPTRTPKPTKTPKPTHDLEPTDTPEPTEEPDEEITERPYSGGGGGGHTQPHAKSTATEGPDYDLIALDKLDGEEIMEQLTLGGETLELTLSREENRGFTVSAMHWKENGEEGPEEKRDNTLVLTAVDAKKEQKCSWELNGAVLRRMQKSGIDHLVFRVGDQIAVLNTGGTLAGWEYEKLKSLGTGSRRFEYEIEMDGETAVWRLRVEGQAYELNEDPHAGIFLKESYVGTAEALTKPYAAVIIPES